MLIETLSRVLNGLQGIQVGQLSLPSPVGGPLCPFSKYCFFLFKKGFILHVLTRLSSAIPTEQLTTTAPPDKQCNPT